MGMPTVLFLVLGEKLSVTFFLGLLWRRLMLCDSVFCRRNGKSIIGFTVPRTNSFRKYSKVFFILYYATNDNKSKNNFSSPWSSLIDILIDTFKNWGRRKNTPKWYFFNQMCFLLQILQSQCKIQFLWLWVIYSCLIYVFWYIILWFK